MKNEFEKLAERCEQSSGPDRELDAEIALAAYGGEIVWRQSNGTMEAYPTRRHVSDNHVGGFGNAPVEAYTASLDAAMTLVADGGEVDLFINRCANGKAIAEVKRQTAAAATATLAICAAALRAHSYSFGDM